MTWLSQACQRLWFKLFLKDARAPQFRVHRPSLIFSLLGITACIAIAGISYWKTTQSLPGVLMAKAAAAAALEDYGSEIEWRRRYFFLNPADLQNQARMTLALDSLLRVKSLDNNERGTFEAIRQLETAENLTDSLAPSLANQIHRRLLKRYLEASDLLATTARRQDDVAMQDSIVGESIGYLNTAMRSLVVNLADDESEEVVAELHKLAIRRELLKQTLHSLAIFEMRSDDSIDRDVQDVPLDQRLQLYSKKHSYWFDDALKKSINATEPDLDFLNTILAYRSNEEFPWNEAADDGWRSEAWKDVPEMVSDAVTSLSSYQGTFVSLRLQDLLGRGIAAPQERTWNQVADQICETNRNPERINSDAEGSQSGSRHSNQNKNHRIRKEWERSEYRAKRSILISAWSALPYDQLNQHENWWNEICRLAKEDSDQELAAILLFRAKRHLENEEFIQSLEFLKRASETKEFVQLGALELLTEISLENTETSEAADKQDTLFAECQTNLDQYQKAIRRETGKVKQLDLPETDRLGRTRKKLLLAHRVKHECMRLALGWNRNRQLASLARFQDLMDECSRLEIRQDFELSSVERIANLLMQSYDYYGVAIHYERALARNPRSTALRNRCFDSWFRIGNIQRAKMFLSSVTSLTDVHGKSRLLFMRLLEILRDPENTGAVGTLREQTELLQLSLLEDDTTESNRNVFESTRQILKYVHAMLPIGDMEFSEHIRSDELRSRILELATQESANAWFNGLAYGLVQFGSPDQRETFWNSLSANQTANPFSIQLQRATVDARLGRYHIAIQRLLSVSDSNKTQYGAARIYAAELACKAAGNVAKREILRTIPREDRTPRQWFLICETELSLVVALRFMGRTSDAEALRRILDEHTDTLSKAEAGETKYSSLMTAWVRFELDALAYDSKQSRIEALEQLTQPLDVMLEREPWWTPLLTLRGLIAAEMNQSEIACTNLQLAVDSGDQSIRTKRKLITHLERLGETIEASKVKSKLKQQTSANVIIWQNYAVQSGRIRDGSRRTQHARDLAMTFDVADAWLMLARSLANACAQNITHKQHKQMIEEAEFSLQRIQQLSESESSTTLAVRHQLALLAKNKTGADAIESDLLRRSDTDDLAADSLVKCLLNRGETEQAMKVLLSLTERSPTESRLLKLAQCQNGLGLTDKAEETLRTAVEIYPESTTARANLAIWASISKSAPEATEQLKALILANDESSSDLDQRSYVETFNALASSDEVNWESVELLIALAKSKKSFAETAAHSALRVISGILVKESIANASTPPHVTTAFENVFALLDENEWTTAIDLDLYGRGLIAARPRVANERMKDILGRVRQTGDLRLALSLEIQWYREEESTDQLAARVENWRTKAIDDEKVPRSIANALACADMLDIGNTPRALQIFEEAYMEEPAALKTYLDLLAKLKRGEDFIKLAEHALTLANTEETDIQIATLCIRYLLKSKTETLRPLCEQLITRRPDSLPILDFASQLNFLLGDHEKAASFLGRLNELRPGTALILNNLAMCLIELPGQVDKALGFAQQAQQLAPHDPTVMDTLAVAYLKKGMAAKAADYLKDAIAIRKEPRYLFHLLMAYEMLGKTKEYREAHSLLSQIDVDVSGLNQTERRLYNKLFL